MHVGDLSQSIYVITWYRGDEIKSRRNISKISSSVKFYTTVTVSKLAKLLDTTPEELRDRLTFIKHKTLYCSEPSAEDATAANGKESGMIGADGASWESVNDAHFYIKDDTVIVSAPASNEQERLGNDTSGDYFVRNISRFENIIQNIKKDWEGMPKPMGNGGRRGQDRGGRGGGRGGGHRARADSSRLAREECQRRRRAPRARLTMTRTQSA